MFLQLISEWIVVVPFVWGLLLFSKLDTASKIIFCVVCIALIPQLATTFLKNVDKEFLNILYNLYTPLEFCFLLFFFYQRNKNRFLILSILLLNIIISIFLFSIKDISNGVVFQMISINNLLYTFLIFLYLIKQFNNDNYLLSISDPYNWYIIGLLLYAPCTFFVFANYLKTSSNLNSGKSVLWVIHNIFNILMYIFFAIGFLKNKSNQLKDS